MSKAPPKRRGDWYTVKQAAGFLGVSEQAVRTSYLPDVATCDVQPARGNIPTKLWGPAVVELAVEKATRRLLREKADDIESGPPSPELEKLRRVRRLREERDFGISLQELVPAAIFWRQAEEVWVHVQRFVGEMIQSHGNGVKDRWEDVVTESKAIAERYAPKSARKRTLHIELEDGEQVEIPLPLRDEE